MSDTSSSLDVHVDHVESESALTRVTRVSTGAEEAGRPFLLVAGMGVAASYFEFLAPTLAVRADVYALDLPGFAGLPQPSAVPTIAFFADRVEEVIAHYGLDDPVLIGHSMGAQVVTEVLARRHDLSDAVLVGPVVNDAEPHLHQVALRFAQSALHESLHLALTVLSAYILCGLRYFLTVLPALLRYPLVERVAQTRTRILFLRGEHDTTSPRRFHSRLVGAASDSARWEIEGAAHSLINGHALGAARLAVRFVDGDLARRGRLAADEAVVPPAPRGDAAMVWAAVGARVGEWMSALRGDERGVARAKRRHARILWRAYSRRTP
jgi:pimeloyl-ACP methyl ester carboxylesterase